MWQPPGWLKGLGVSSWYFLGLLGAVLIVGAALSALAQITIPLVFAAIIGAVFSPWVDWFVRSKIKRGLAAMMVLLLIVAVGAGLVFVVLYGVVNQMPQIKAQAQAGIHKIQKSIDANTTDQQSKELTEDIQKGVETAAKGLAGAVPQIIRGIAGLFFTLFIMVNIMFFMLKDGGPIGDWLARHASPLPGGKGLSRHLLHISSVSMRRYLLGVSIVAIFNSAAVGIAAVLLGVPLAGTIAIVTFAFAFIPYLGAVISGVFAVVMAISTSPTAAVIMVLVVFISNGALQTVINQIAMKKTLSLYPLVSLIVTLVGGVVAGALGAFLAVPVTAILIRVTAEYKNAVDAGDGASAERGAAAGEGPPGEHSMATDDWSPKSAGPELLGGETAES